MHCEANEHFVHQSSLAFQQLVLTIIMVAGFFWTKTLYDRARRKHARVTVVVVGAGPVGLMSVLIAAKNDHVREIYLYEELYRNAMMNKPYQLAFDLKSVAFLQRFGVDFDSMEGCWDNKRFFTCVGVFQDYVLSLLHNLPIDVHLNLGTKFTRSCIPTVEGFGGRVLVITCDGTNGQASRILGLSDEFSQHSCKSYGAVASLDRQDLKTVPYPERKFHNLLFDLTAYGGNDGADDAAIVSGFTFKLFGNSRHRFMTLAIPKSECTLVKTMRLVLDRSMMRNIFLKCYNTYRSDVEAELGESAALKHLKYSPRLFELKLFKRLETVAYFEEPDMFVVAEGDCARCYNFNTGADINLNIKGLMSLPSFISMATWAREEYDIMNTMLYKARHAEHVCKDFLRYGLKEVMFSQH